jgi:hypothetical protein
MSEILRRQERENDFNVSSGRNSCHYVYTCLYAHERMHVCVRMHVYVYVCVKAGCYREAEEQCKAAVE